MFWKQIIVLSTISIAAYTLDNGAGNVPPMGFNTFWAFGCQNLNEAGVKK
jgi:hypothetical protein